MAEPKQEWAHFEEKGLSYLEIGRYLDAIQLFNKAITFFQENPNKEVITEIDLNSYLAHLYVCRAKSFKEADLLSLHADATPVGPSFLQCCLDDLEKALKLAPLLEEVHIISADVALYRGHTDDANKSLWHALALLESKGIRYESQPEIRRLMAESHFMVHSKKDSENWCKVRFPERCYVVDPMGAGDFLDVETAMKLARSGVNKFSLLVKPGRYKVREQMLVTADCEVQVLGDVSSGGQEKVIIEVDISAVQSTHMFSVSRGRLSLAQLVLNHSGNIPDKYIVVALAKEDTPVLQVFNCHFLSKFNTAIYTSGGDVTISASQFDTCQTGLMLAGTNVSLTGCVFFKSATCAIEVQKGATCNMTSCLICDSNTAIRLSNGAGELIMDKCAVLRSGFGDPIRPAVDVQGASSIVITDSHFVGIGSGAVLIRGDVYYTSITNCYFCEGNFGVALFGLNQHGDIKIQENRFDKFTFAVAFLQNLSGNSVIMKDNTITNSSMDVLCQDKERRPRVIDEPVRHEIFYVSSEGKYNEEVHKKVSEVDLRYIAVFLSAHSTQDASKPPGQQRKVEFKVPATPDATQLPKLRKIIQGQRSVAAKAENSLEQSSPVVQMEAQLKPVLRTGGSKSHPSTGATSENSKSQTSTAAKPESSKSQPITAAKPDSSKLQPSTAAKPESSKSQPCTAAKPESSKSQPSTAAKPESSKSQPSAAAKPESSKSQPSAAAKPEGQTNTAAKPNAAKVQPTTVLKTEDTNGSKVQLSTTAKTDGSKGQPGRSTDTVVSQERIKVAPRTEGYEEHTGTTQPEHCSLAIRTECMATEGADEVAAHGEGIATAMVDESFQFKITRVQVSPSKSQAIEITIDLETPHTRSPLSGK